MLPRCASIPSNLRATQNKPCFACAKSAVHCCNQEHFHIVHIIIKELLKQDDFFTFQSSFSPRSSTINFNFIIIPAVNNLNEKEKLPELKKALATLFSKFGKILNIVAMSSFSRKGQAFIVYETVEQATAAMMQLQNFPFPSEEKRMRITYAKAKSDIVAKADGTFVQSVYK